MPRKPVEKLIPGKVCHGGQSWGCRHDAHPIGKNPDVLCMRCFARMGCSSCIEIPRELICLRCHDWADLAGLEAHGPMVRRNRSKEQLDMLLAKE
jgi:hypothetical protein